MVFQTGSFPLRTFLIEGDIDLTIIIGKEHTSDEKILENIKERLESEKDNKILWIH